MNRLAIRGILFAIRANYALKLPRPYGRGFVVKGSAMKGTKKPPVKGTAFGSMIKKPVKKGSKK